MIRTLRERVLPVPTRWTPATAWYVSVIVLIAAVMVTRNLVPVERAHATPMRNTSVSPAPLSADAARSKNPVRSVTRPVGPAGNRPAGDGVATLMSSGIPETVLKAYRAAAARLARERSECHLPLGLLAAIGRVESGHAQGGNVDAAGTTRTPILGPPLNGGPGVAAIRDTDRGGYDGDRTWDRAVGPMQFIPSTWRGWAADGNGDGAADPHNVFDATVAAGHYLCAAGGDLAGPDGLRRAVLAYNHSEEYLALVSAWLRVYAGATAAIPDQHAAGAPDEPTPARAPQHRRSQPEPKPTTQPDPSPAPRPSPTTSPAPAPPSDDDPVPLPLDGTRAVTESPSRLATPWVDS